MVDEAEAEGEEMELAARGEAGEGCCGAEERKEEGVEGRERVEREAVE